MDAMLVKSEAISSRKSHEAVASEDLVDEPGDVMESAKDRQLRLRRRTGVWNHSYPVLIDEGDSIAEAIFVIELELDAYVARLADKFASSNGRPPSTATLIEIRKIIDVD